MEKNKRMRIFQRQMLNMACQLATAELNQHVTLLTSAICDPTVTLAHAADD